MQIKLMCEHERDVIAHIDVPDKKRDTRIEYHGVFYEAARVDDDGVWIYRQQPETK